MAKYDEENEQKYRTKQTPKEARDSAKVQARQDRTRAKNEPEHARRLKRRGIK